MLVVVVFLAFLAFIVLSFLVAFWVYVFWFVRDVPSILRRIADNLENIKKNLDK